LLLGQAREKTATNLAQSEEAAIKCGRAPSLAIDLPARRRYECELVDEEEQKKRAMELWDAGYQRHLQNDLEGAIDLYSRSIQTWPTAEAYTFRGWAYERMGRIDEAIAECRKAIEIDPDYGNPYNDIGAYLIAKGELDDAIPWLERAKQARRYEPRHFPYLNLGRVYVAKGMITAAAAEFERALEMEPNDLTSRQLLAHLRAMLN
jgi:Tfp pilus assembly protein PilF